MQIPVQNGLVHGLDYSGKGVKASHNVVVAFALIGCLGFLAYGFIGLGKFIEIFIPWSIIQPYIPLHIAPEYVAHFYGIIFTLFAMFYSVLVACIVLF